jgi:photosystem II stability/assembly factor-like uncharacterized protein
MKKVFSLISFLFLFISSQAQPEGAWMHAPYLNINSAQDEWKRTNFYEIQKAFNAYEKDWEKTHPERISLRADGQNWEEEFNSMPGRLQYKRWENFMAGRISDSGEFPLTSLSWQIYSEYLLNNNHLGRTMSASNWTSLGPSSGMNNLPYTTYIGRVNFVKIHPTNTNIMFAGAATGGLWKSTDAGASWTPLTDFLGSLGCSDLAINPLNPNVMYLATGDCDAYGGSIGLCKTTDGGVNWTVVGLVYTLYKVIINPADTNMVIVGTSSGLWRSLNGGSNWTQVITANQFKDVKFKPGDPTVVYAASHFNTGFYKSTNSGSTFTQITSFGLPATGRVLIGVSSANSAYVYLLHVYGYFKSFYRSIDSGDNFVIQSDQASAGNIIGNQGFYDAAVVVNPFDAEDVYVGGINTYRSTNGGVTWNGLPTNPDNHVDVHGLEFLPGSSTTLFDCTDGGLVRSTNNGSSWSTITEGMAISEIYRISNSNFDPNLILEGSQDNGTHRMNSTIGWRMVCGGDGGCSVMDYTNPDIMYVSEMFGRYFKTTNATTTFNLTMITDQTGSAQNAFGGQYAPSPMLMNPMNHNTLVLGKREIYRSYDAGATWSPMSGVVTGYFMTLAWAPSDSNYIYAYDGNKKFYACTDGNNFVDRTSTFPDLTNRVYSIAISSTNPQKLWICVNGYTSNRVWVSVNAGLSWTSYSTGLPAIPANTLAYQNGSSDELYLGMDIGVYYRNSTMASWQLFNTNLPNVIIDDLKIQYSSGKLRAGTFGRGVWETPLFNTVGIKDIYHLETNISIYPNPTSGSFTIQSKLQNAELKIFDAAGRIVYEQILTSPNQQITHHFSPGIYLVKVSDGEKMFTQKLVIE